MMKRLVITGLPCPAGTWEAFLGSAPGQRIITMYEVLAHTEGSDPRDLSRYITEQLELERPQSIVCHGMGVPLTLMALMRLKRQGIELDAKLTVFNGAFRNASITRARQPLRMQFTPMKRVLKEVQRNGGQIDPQLMPYAARIRSLFRLLVLHRLAEKMSHVIGLDFLDRFPKRAGLKMPVQIIASPNDPYLPPETLEQLRRDLEPDRYVEIDYGHFPYSAGQSKIPSLIRTFEESAPTHSGA